MSISCCHWNLKFSKSERRPCTSSAMLCASGGGLPFASRVGAAGGLASGFCAGTSGASGDGGAENAEPAAAPVGWGWSALGASAFGAAGAFAAAGGGVGAAGAAGGAAAAGGGAAAGGAAAG